MKKYFKEIIVILLISITSCNLAQQTQKSILEECFKKHFFKDKTSYINFEKGLLQQGFLTNNKEVSYHKFFSEYFPYNTSRNENYIKRKYALSTLLNQYFKTSDSLDICFNVNKEEILSNTSPKMVKFQDAMSKIHKIITSVDSSKNWENYDTFPEVFRAYFKEDWFTSLDVKYISIFFIYRDLKMYTKNTMNRDIIESKISYDEREIVKKEVKKEKITEVIEIVDSEEGEFIEETVMLVEETAGNIIESNVAPEEKTEDNNDFKYKLDELVRFNHLNLETIPKKIWKEKYISHLELCNNNLKNIPNDIGKLIYLEYLDLSDNNLTKLPDAIKNLNKLRVLKLKNNPISKGERENIKNLVPIYCKIIFD